MAGKWMSAYGILLVQCVKETQQKGIQLDLGN